MTNDIFFDEDYLLSLMHLAISDANYLDILSKHLKYEYIPNENIKKIWQAILTEYNLSEIKRPPTIPILKQHFRKDLKVLEYLVLLKEADFEDKDSIIRKLEEFIRQNMFSEFFNEVADLYNKGSHNKAYEVFYPAAEKLKNFSLQNKVYDQVFNKFNERYVRRETEKMEDHLKQKRIPFGIAELDYFTKGAQIGEAVLFLADSGAGKSFLMNHLGVSAARRGEKILHFQAEGTRSQVLDRYDSCWTGSLYWDIKENNFTEEAKHKMQLLIKDIGGEIYVDCFEKFESRTMLDIRSAIIDMKKDVDITYVILDYLELVNPDNRVYGFSEERFRQTKIARMIKDIAVEQKVVFVTPTQSNGINPENLNDPNFLLTRYNLNEDKGKIRPFDLMITLNQTRDEKMQQTMRLYIDKAREHSGKQVMRIAQDLSRSRFYNHKRTLKEFLTEQYIYANNLDLDLV